MANNYHQLSLKDTFSDCTDMFMDDVPSFISMAFLPHINHIEVQKQIVKRIAFAYFSDLIVLSNPKFDNKIFMDFI